MVLEWYLALIVFPASKKGWNFSFLQIISISSENHRTFYLFTIWLIFILDKPEYMKEIHFLFLQPRLKSFKFTLHNIITSSSNDLNLFIDSAFPSYNYFLKSIFRLFWKHWKCVTHSSRFSFYYWDYNCNAI